MNEAPNMGTMGRLLASRRSVRKFLAKPIPNDIVGQLLEAGRLAPSRANSQPWRFVVITEQEIKDRLYEAAYRQEAVRAAPLLIAVLGVIDPRDNVSLRTAELVQAGAFGADVKERADHILDDWTDAELKVDAALNSAIAATHIMLAAHGLGLGCCWIKLCQDGEVLKILGAPEGYYNAGVLAIGYPGESPPARPRLPLTSLAYSQRFGRALHAGLERSSAARQEGERVSVHTLAHLVQGGTPMIVVVNYRVRDFWAWKWMFDKNQSVRETHGATGHFVYRPNDDPKRAIVHIEFPSQEHARAFLADPSLAETMARAGVEGEPEVAMWDLAEVLAYGTSQAA